MALPSIGLHTGDFVRVSQLAGLCTQNDNVNTALNNMKDMFEKFKNHEEENEKERANMTPEQVAIEDANKILDKMVFVDDDDRDWTTVRKEMGDIYANAGLNEMALFVDPTRS
jgi:predicted RNase H-like HicB family nuclease